MTCPACGTEIRPGVRFCEQCGASLALACRRCQAPLAPGARFCGQCGAAAGAADPRPAAGAGIRHAEPQAYTPPHLAQRILRDRAALTGERKQVTVLFADVAGFTSLSERLDPEDVHGLINRAFELMLAEIHRYEGTVNQFLGDGLMALFGAPLAHEDHALRAAHAALGAQQALDEYRQELAGRGIDFRVRMGMNTGLVVVGAIGDNLRMDYTAVGDTTNTAARLQQLAEPGQIVVAAATQRLIAPYFELRALGTFSVRHRERPVAAWALVRPRPAASRLAARAARGLSPFVGRDEALATLQHAWTAARAGRGQVVFVVGDAGIGKSRLLLEFRRRLGEAAAWVEGECISYGQTTPFLPIITMLRRSFGIEDRDRDADIVARVRRGLAPLGPDAAAGEPYLRYLLKVDPGDATVAGMEASPRRARIVEALERLTAAASRRHPVVLVVEDAHWIDDASEQLLQSLVTSLAGLAVLLIVTYRPAYQQPFGDRSYFWRIPLQPVETSAAAEIVRASLGAADLPRELVAAVAAKAEGNPFFIEEIGRTLLETGAVRLEQGRLVATASAATLVVPDTVQDVIAARIDRLAEPQKRTVQTASVIGREFTLGLLRRISDVQEQLEKCLADLKQIELIYQTSLRPDDPRYAFRHALTQDVAYTSLLQAERRRLHAAIGAAIEDLYAARLEDHVEELVHHFQIGEVWDRVVRYGREAGDRAARLFVDRRAVEFYELALDALGHLPETAETARAGIEIRLALRPPLWRAGRLEPLFQRFREAEALATRWGISEVLDTIYAYLVQYHWAKGNPDEALSYGDRCLALAETRDDLGLRVTGLFYRAHTYHTTGRHREAIADCEAIIAALAGRERERFGLSGLPYCGACGMAALALAELGDMAAALAMAERGVAVADAADHLYSQCAIRATLGTVLVHAGRPHEVPALVEPVVAACREKNFAGQFMLAALALAGSYAVLGRGREAADLAGQAIALQESLQAYSDRAWMHAIKAQGHLAAGELDAAAEDVRHALEYAARHGERGWEAWAHYVGGMVAARGGDRRAAAHHLAQARDRAEALGLGTLMARLGEAPVAPD